MKAIIPRVQVEWDVDKAIAYYLAQGTPQVALGFVDTLEKAYTRIARHPAAGSPRYAHEFNLPGLRVWPLERYPHLIFYVERPDAIDIWRVLHGHRDIPAWMRDAGDDV